MGTRIETFRIRLHDRQPMMGTFLKTPSYIVAEVLGLSSLDVVAIDGEHAPFGRIELDACIAACRAADLPSLVRVGDASPRQIQNALDCGATGIIVPHVRSAEQAAAVVKAAHFGEGGRGYAGSPRAAGYGTKKMPDHLSDSRAHTTVVVQIEDLAALDQVAAIAAVDGVDCLFVGRVDLAVAMGKAVSAGVVIDTVGDICIAGAEKPVGMFTPDLDELPKWRSAGASLFLLGSDHSMLLAGANQLASSIR